MGGKDSNPKRMVHTAAFFSVFVLCHMSTAEAHIKGKRDRLSAYAIAVP